MRNIALALLAGILFGAALYYSGLLTLAEAWVPGVLAALAVYFILARRTFRQVEGIVMESSKALQMRPARFDVALATLQKASALASHQVGIRSQVNAQIGMIYFLQKEFSKALPYLKSSLMLGHWMGGAMLGVVYYKKKNYDQMRKTFQMLSRRAKKQGLVWSLYAYLLVQTGDQKEAQKILAQGMKHAPHDPRVKDALLALQNGKKMKMRAYQDQWYQFHLERPPVEYVQNHLPGRMGKLSRRGRW